MSSKLRMLAIALGMAANAAGAAAYPIENRPDNNFYPTATRSRKPTSNKHRGDARRENRKKNKAAKKARKGSRK